MEAVSDVEVSVALLEVASREEDLPDFELVFGEGVVPCVHEAGLTDCGDGLEFIDVLGALGELEVLYASGDGSGGDEGDVDLVLNEDGDLCGEFSDEGFVNTAVGVREELRADLDDDAADVTEGLLSEVGRCHDGFCGREVWFIRRSYRAESSICGGRV